MSTMSELAANIDRCRNAAADLMELYAETENSNYAKMADGWLAMAMMWEGMAE